MDTWQREDVRTANKHRNCARQLGVGRVQIKPQRETTTGQGGWPAAQRGGGWGGGRFGPACLADLSDGSVLRCGSLENSGQFLKS